MEVPSGRVSVNTTGGKDKLNMYNNCRQINIIVKLSLFNVFRQNVSIDLGASLDTLKPSTASKRRKKRRKKKKEISTRG